MAAPGRPGASAPAWGTAAAKAAAAVPGGAHSDAVSPVSRAASAADDSDGALPTTVLAASGHGGYVSAGIGMRNQGDGTIKIGGIPGGATVESAVLIWNVLDNAASAADASGTFNGKAITGDQVGTGGSPCWEVGANYSFETDVTPLVTGNGDYTLTGFASGDVDNSDPFSSGEDDPPLLEGASLVVVYRDDSMPWASFQIDAGGQESDPSTGAAADTFDGFTIGSKSTVTTTFIVADGQMAGNTAAVNDDTLDDVTFPGSAPQAAPAFSQGSLWDNVTEDITGEVSAGDTSIDMSVAGGGDASAGDDCVVWVGQVLDVSGATVLGLGDSVAAGYGLGDSIGNGDNAGAYPAVLAKELGGTADDMAIEGACSVQTEEFCKDRDSVDLQLDAVKADFSPTVVTLTVGADDIDFSQCIATLLEDNDLNINDPKNDCTADKNAPNNLSKSLTAFEAGLTSDLTDIQAKYPDVPILIMDYYNPFAPPVANDRNVCAISEGLVVNKTYKTTNSWLAVVQQYIGDHSAFLAEAAKDQQTLYTDASGILNKLNGTIDDVADGFSGVTVVDPTAFTGHDICSGGAEWVFAPTLSIAFAHVERDPADPKKEKLVKEDLGFKLSGGDACPDPLNEDTKAKVLKLADFTGSGNDKKEYAALVFVMRLNCFPHPTALGQQQLAAAFSAKFSDQAIPSS